MLGIVGGWIIPNKCDQQLLFIHCRYIQIVGTHNTVNRVFHLVSFECMYSKSKFNLEDGIIGNIFSLT